jgi:hypothetical protein
MAKKIEKVLALMKQEGVTVSDILSASGKLSVNTLKAQNTCVQLRKLCKNNGLPTNGTKQVLAQRIFDNNSLRDDVDNKEDEDEGCSLFSYEDESDGELVDNEWGEEGVDWCWA